MIDIQNSRLAVIATLVEMNPGMDRTELMRLCYFLQTLRGVRLGYRFTLYSHGPSDPDVLSDLAAAELFGGLQSNIVLRSNSYAYEIEPSKKITLLKNLATDFVKRHDADFNWVIEHFGRSKNGDLDTLSTIVFADRECEGITEKLSEDALIQKVSDVKPYLNEAYIGEMVKILANLGLLQNLKSGSARSVAA
jgi:hypothetical protein